MNPLRQPRLNQPLLLIRKPPEAPLPVPLHTPKINFLPTEKELFPLLPTPLNPKLSMTMTRFLGAKNRLQYFKTKVEWICGMLISNSLLWMTNGLVTRDRITMIG